MVHAVTESPGFILFRVNWQKEGQEVNFALSQPGLQSIGVVSQLI